MESNDRPCISLPKAFVIWFLDKAGTLPVITEPSIVRSISYLQKKNLLIEMRADWGGRVCLSTCFITEIINGYERNLMMYEIEWTDSTDNTAGGIKFN
jgi:hypothetical protein